MLSRSLNFGMRILPRRAITQITAKNSTSVPPDIMYDKDPAPYFFNQEIQKLLQTVTRPIPEKVFRNRLDGHAIEVPEYKFMTDEELKKAQDEAEKQMWKRLQMPPVVKIRKDDDRIISNDPELLGHDKNKYVFTDITFGISNKKRVIVVREPNGILHPAKHEDRDRLNQLYFPLKDREITMPKMFEEEHLQPVLERKDYEFILDRACIQFDPDHPDFHRVVKTTYEYVNENMDHDKLRSTRHYGPMVFYFAWSKNIDNILLENITTERIEDAALVVQLYYKLNPSENPIQETDHIKLLQHYIENNARNKRKVDHALKTYLELESERRKLAENIEKSHGRVSSSNEEIKT